MLLKTVKTNRESTGTQEIENEQFRAKNSIYYLALIPTLLSFN